MALDEFRDGFDPHGVTLLIDAFDLLGSREAPPDVLHGAVGELHEIGLEHFEEAERALAAVETGESEATAQRTELRLDILQLIGVQQGSVPAELEGEEPFGKLRALDVLGDEVRELGLAQRVLRKVDAVCGHRRAGRRPGAGFLYPGRKAAHDPAIDVRQQPVLLQHGKERSRREQLLLFLLEADEDLLERRRVSGERQDFLGVEQEATRLQRRNQLVGDVSLYRALVFHLHCHVARRVPIRGFSRGKKMQELFLNGIAQMRTASSGGSFAGAPIALLTRGITSFAISSIERRASRGSTQSIPA